MRRFFRWIAIIAGFAALAIQRREPGEPAEPVVVSLDPSAT